MLVILYDTEIAILDCGKTEFIKIEKEYTVRQSISNGSYLVCIKVNDNVILEICSNNFCLIDKRI